MGWLIETWEGTVAYEYTPEGWQSSRQLDPGSEQYDYFFYYPDASLRQQLDVTANSAVYRYSLAGLVTSIEDTSGAWGP